MAIELIKEHVNEYMCKLDNYFDNIFNDFGRFYINPENFNIDGLYSLDILFNEIGESSIYYSKIMVSDTKFLYFFGLDSEDVVKNNKLINFDDFINPNFAITLDFDYETSGMVFALEEGDLVLLMQIDYNSLTREEISRLEDKSNIEKIGDTSFINFGSFNDGDRSFLRKIKNFIANVKIQNNTFDLISLSTVRLPRGVLPNENTDFEFDTKKYNYCMICGENIDETYDFNPQMKDFAGENPNKCASCQAKILMSYFYSVMEGKSINRTYLLSLTRTPSLIKFYLNLLETNGIINRTRTIEFKEDLTNEYYQTFFDEIPEEYKITYFKNNPVKKHSELFEKIDEITLNIPDSLNTNFQKILLENGLSLEDGWNIREELIQLVKEGELKKNTIKAVNKAIKKVINKHTQSPSNKSKKSIKKINSLNMFKQAQQLNKLTLSKDMSYKKEYLNKLLENELSLDYANIIRNQLIDEIEEGKIKNSVEDRLIKIIEETTKSDLEEEDGSVSDVVDSEPDITIETQDTSLHSPISSEEKLEINVFKEYIFIDNLIILKSIIINSDMGAILKIITFIKEITNCKIETIRVFELNEKFLNVFIEISFSNEEYKDLIIKLLKKSDFKEISLI